MGARYFARRIGADCVGSVVLCRVAVRCDPAFGSADILSVGCSDGWAGIAFIVPLSAGMREVLSGAYCAPAAPTNSARLVPRRIR